MKGRPGAKNVKTLEWEAFGRRLLEVGLPRAMVIMETCEDVEFMDNFQKLLEYFKPKLARTEVTGKDGVELFPKPILDVRKNDGNRENTKSN